MSAADLALVVAATLCVLAFAALAVTLMRVRDALSDLRSDLAAMRAETADLVTRLAESTDGARDVMAAARADLDRFDRVLGSAEAISSGVVATTSSRLARVSMSTPMIKAAGLATGTSRAVRRLRKGA